MTDVTHLCAQHVVMCQTLQQNPLPQLAWHWTGVKLSPDHQAVAILEVLTDNFLLLLLYLVYTTDQQSIPF